MMKSDHNRRILVVAGPTAVGKSAFALKIAEEFDGEIISCDSMQVYRHMDIGSAKPTEAERRSIPHHLLDFIEPGEDFSAAKYALLARKAVEEVASREKLPIICGGTGLYLNGILYEMNYGRGPQDRKLRETLEKQAEEEGPIVLHDELRQMDPGAAEKIHPNNVKRVIRALERLKLGEDAIEDFQTVRKENPRIDPLMVGLSRDRQELYQRIDLRVEKMMEEGLLDEVRSLRDRGLSRKDIAMLGIGYKELLAFLDGETSLEEAVELIKRNSRHLAKRQFTWFHRYDKMKWLNISDYPDEESAMKELIHWLKKKL